MTLDHLLKSLLALSRETEWVEFKHNNDAPEEIGEYLSALANSAALHGREAGYIVWGIRACYQHACLCWVVKKAMTNATVRERFGVEVKNAAVASRIIAETVKAALVKPADPGSKSKKHAQYVPFWL